MYFSRRIMMFVPLISCVATHASAGPTYIARILNPPALYAMFPQGSSVGSQVGYAYGMGTRGDLHAFMAHDSSENVIDLHSGAFRYSSANAVDGGSQVGYGDRYESNNYVTHALLWHGTASSLIDLHPAQFQSSVANGVSGDSQVGYGSQGRYNTSHALLWHGTAASVVDLHSSNFESTYATGASGGTQVGNGFLNGGPLPGGRVHALAWNGTAESLVDLHPAGFDNSMALGVAGSVQVGFGFNGVGALYYQGPSRALIWTGTAQSVVNLHPTGFENSRAVAAAGLYQVGFGYGINTDDAHALLWSGSSESVVDLHGALASLGRSFTTSFAYGVASNGDVVGEAYGPEGFAILWVRVPEPSSVAILYGISIGALFRRRRKD